MAFVHHRAHYTPGAQGQSFGAHVDNAIRQGMGTGHRIRTDLSGTRSSAHPTSNKAANDRIGALFWVQSMVRDDGERTLVFDLDVAIQRLRQEIPVRTVWNAPLRRARLKLKSVREAFVRFLRS